MEVLSNSRDVGIGKLTVTTIAGHQYNYNSTAKRALHSLLDPILDASHARNRKISPPDSSCLPGTRENIIRKVTSWARKNVVLDSNHVYWLYGYVGCGKSAIAQAIAERFQERERLAASFFFFRNSGARGKISKLAVTIASQMAAAIPATAPLIEAAVTADPSLLTSSVTVWTQFQRLVCKPFIIAVGWGLELAMLLRGPFLIIIDGLDECDDHGEVAEFIDHMLTFFENNPLVPLRVLITSRVEEHIRTRLQRDKVTMDNLVDHCSDDDIAAVVRAAFDYAAKHNRVVQAYGNWPAQTEVRSLVKSSRGSFIFISVLLKYILGPSNDGLTPMERLPLALDINRHASLDGLYAETLARSKDLPHFTDVISTIALVKEPLSVANIAGMLEVNIFEVVRVLVNLHAILQVPGDDVTSVTVCHSSLHDFLTTESRSGPFFASPSFHKRLAYRCLDLTMQYPNEMLARYAVKHWLSHFRLASCLQLDNDGDLHILYSDVNNALRQRFPKSAAILIPAYFLCTLTDRFYKPWIQTLAVILEPMVPAGETLSMIRIFSALKAMDPFYTNPSSSNDSSTEYRVWALRLGESNLPHFSDYMHLPLRCISLLLGSPSRVNDDGFLLRILIHLPLYIKFALDRDPTKGDLLESICGPVDVARPVEIDDSIHLASADASDWRQHTSAAITAIMAQRPASVKSVRVDDPSRWRKSEFWDDFCESQGPLSVMGLLEGFSRLGVGDFATLKIRLGGGVGISFRRDFGDFERVIHRKSYTYDEKK